METVRFRHAHFSAHFPVDCRYAPSHYWMRPADDAAAQGAAGLWRVGLTKFGTRMLGELVEMVLEVEPGAVVAGGSRLGTVEGFKAVSDLFCVVEGTFEAANPAVGAEGCLTHSDPYGAGWLYAVRGTPAPGALDVHGYIAVLAATIDKLQASRYGGDSAAPADDAGDPHAPA
jgi:glycine cleavage system H protein